MLVQAWRTQAARAGPFSDALKELYSTVADQNIHLAVSYISSGENPADEPSRKLSPADCKLAPHLWSLLQEHPRFGGPSGHSIDLMALDSNTQDGKDGKPLPHFTPYPMPGSSGVDIFAQDLSSPESDPLLRNLYVFPPIILIGPVIRLLQENNCSSTIVIPDPQDISSACPRDLCRFLVWKDSHVVWCQTLTTINMKLYYIYG
ncbi:hypothetical protein QZH41_002605 [Actinostola sp. cb2023]|nr:hypothetical protein QZH41_002605 [Actinostola sp. cb2023]